MPLRSLCITLRRGGSENTEGNEVKMLETTAGKFPQTSPIYTTLEKFYINRRKISSLLHSWNLTLFSILRTFMHL